MNFDHADPKAPKWTPPHMRPAGSSNAVVAAQTTSVSPSTVPTPSTVLFDDLSTFARSVNAPPGSVAIKGTLVTTDRQNNIDHLMGDADQALTGFVVSSKFYTQVRTDCTSALILAIQLEHVIASQHAKNTGLRTLTRHGVHTIVLRIRDDGEFDPHGGDAPEQLDVRSVPVNKSLHISKRSIVELDGTAYNHAIDNKEDKVNFSHSFDEYKWPPEHALLKSRAQGRVYETEIKARSKFVHSEGVFCYLPTHHQGRTLPLLFQNFHKMLQTRLRDANFQHIFRFYANLYNQKATDINRQVLKPWLSHVAKIKRDGHPLRPFFVAGRDGSVQRIVQKGQMNPHSLDGGSRPAPSFAFPGVLSFRDHDERNVINGVCILQLIETAERQAKAAAGISIGIHILRTPGGRDLRLLGILSLPADYPYVPSQNTGFKVKFDRASMKDETSSYDWKGVVLGEGTHWNWQPINSYAVQLIKPLVQTSNGGKAFTAETPAKVCDAGDPEATSDVFSKYVQAKDNAVMGKITWDVSTNPHVAQLARQRMLYVNRKPESLKPTEKHAHERFGTLLLGQDSLETPTNSTFLFPQHMSREVRKDGENHPADKLIRHESLTTHVDRLILLGEADPVKLDWMIRHELRQTSITDHQLAVICNMHTARNGFALVVGPFGTGKTRILVISDACLLLCDRKVLSLHVQNDQADDYLVKWQEIVEHSQNEKLKNKVVIRHNNMSTRNGLTKALLKSVRAESTKEYVQKMRWTNEDTSTMAAATAEIDNVISAQIQQPFNIQDRRVTAKNYNHTLPVLTMKKLNRDTTPQELNPDLGDGKIPITTAPTPTEAANDQPSLEILPPEERKQAHPQNVRTAEAEAAARLESRRRRYAEAMREVDETDLEVQMSALQRRYIKFEQAREYDEEDKAELENQQRQTDQAVIKSADLIITTHYGATDSLLCGEQDDLESVFEPDAIRVDESGRIPFSDIENSMARYPFADFLLIGDFKQLNPFQHDTMDNSFAHQVNVSFLERMVVQGYPTSTLIEQRRQVEEIASISSELTYGGIIRTLVDDASRPNYATVKSLHARTFGQAFGKGAVLVDMTGTSVEKIGLTKSMLNTIEAQHMIALAKVYVNGGIKPEDVTLLVGYKMQARYLQQLLASAQLSCRVRILDAFQGQESSVIILGMTAVGNPGFMRSQDRMNTALTRARDGLAIFGNFASFTRRDGRIDFLRKLWLHFHERKAIVRLNKFIAAGSGQS